MELLLLREEMRRALAIAIAMLADDGALPSFVLIYRRDGEPGFMPVRLDSELDQFRLAALLGGLQATAAGFVVVSWSHAGDSTRAGAVRRDGLCLTVAASCPEGDLALAAHLGCDREGGPCVREEELTVAPSGAGIRFFRGLWHDDARQRAATA